MALKRQPRVPCTLPGAGGSQSPGKKLRLVGGAEKEVAAQSWHHTQSCPFKRPRDRGSGHRVCDLGSLLLLSRP